MSMSLAPRFCLLAGTGLAALSMAVAATPAHAVIPNETKTPAEIVDNADTFRGVGVIVTNQVGQGGVGICTATLINPTLRAMPRWPRVCAHPTRGRRKT